jgi:hypothetical protein
MVTQTHWKETFEYQPWNPAQKGMVHYTGLPGGYSTFYYNQIPNTTGLVGAGIEYMDPQSGATITPVPPVFGQAEEGQYKTGHLVAFAAVAAILGAAAGFGVSKLVL